MEWLLDNLGMLTGFLLGVGVVSFYAGKIVNLLKELADVLLSIVQAFEDNKITKEEIETVKKEVEDVEAAIKAFKEKPEQQSTT